MSKSLGANKEGKIAIFPEKVVVLQGSRHEREPFAIREIGSYDFPHIRRMAIVVRNYREITLQQPLNLSLDK